MNEGDTVRILSGDDEGRLATVLNVRDDGSVVIDVHPAMHPDIWSGETVQFEEGLEVVNQEEERPCE